MMKFVLLMFVLGVPAACAKDARAPAESAAPPEAKPVKSSPSPAPRVRPGLVVPGESIGPIALGMERSQVEKLTQLKPHPQYSAMTLPVTVYYQDDRVSSIQVSLLHASFEVEVGDEIVARDADSESLVALFGDCAEPDIRIGGTTIACRDGGLAISVGGGNPNEVWLRVPAP